MKKRILMKILGVLILICLTCACAACADFDIDSNKSNGTGKESEATPTVQEEMYDVTFVVEFRENILLNKYDVNLFVDGEQVKTLSHGEGTEFDANLTKGAHKVKVENVNNSEVNGELTVTISQDSIVSIYVRTERTYVTVNEQSIEAKSTPIPEEPSAEPDVTLVETPIPTETKEPEPTSTPTPEPTNTPTPEPTSTPTPEPTNTPTPEPTKEPTPTPKSKSVYYSTNNSDTVKNGNSGVYAYKDQGKKGTANYLIIDFDKGYVYWFSESNSSYYDRTKLVYGDLNSYVLMTYYDPSGDWSYGLHFKWAKQPDTLIMQDEYGYEYKYAPTDLEEALADMNSRIMQDFTKKVTD